MKALEFLDAAVEVLRDAGRPMTSNEITEVALQRGLIETRGKTPRATMSPRLYIYIRDHPEGLVVRVAEPGRTRARRDPSAGCFVAECAIELCPATDWPDDERSRYGLWLLES